MIRKNINRIKRCVNKKIGIKFKVNPQIDIDCERIGTDYGGNSIVKGSLNSKSIVYSFGIGCDASFDMDLIGKYNVKVYAFDPTPESLKWVGEQGFSKRFIMHDYGLASKNGFLEFNMPTAKGNVSLSATGREGVSGEKVRLKVCRLSTIMKKLGHKRVDLLKVDIEGSEYEVFEDIVKSGLDVRQILVEFHHRFENIGFKKTKAAIRLLNDAGYKIFAVTSNGENYSFIKDEK